MASENPVWGEERIANELLIKLGIRVSPRTVGKYMPKRPAGQPRGDQRWATFLKNHALAIVACDFFVAVIATFRLLYVFLVIEHRRRRLAHVGVTNHPTADWTLQQLREVVGDERTHRYLIHDRDSIFAKHLDKSIQALGLKVLRTPFRSPKANSICGSLRRAPGERLRAHADVRRVASPTPRERAGDHCEPPARDCAVRPVHPGRERFLLDEGKGQAVLFLPRLPLRTRASCP